jgi:hypothetical protein
MEIIEQAIAKGRFALGGWNSDRSNQYSISQINTAAAIAARAHDLPLQIPYKRAHPAAPQPAPVMDRYNGLRLASNSYNTSQARRAAKKRVTPQTDNINTAHSRRVTLKGLLEGMEAGLFE